MVNDDEPGKPGAEEYDPHCLRCDVSDCDALLPHGLEAEYIKVAGHKPTAGIMRSAWEHALMVWCKAWHAARGKR